jgi:hypothetical protein
VSKAPGNTADRKGLAMNQDCFVTALLDIIIDHKCGVLSSVEALTATVGAIRSYSGPQATNPTVGQALYEVIDALPEVELFVIGVPLVLAALAASDVDHDWCEYGGRAAAAEAALLECYMDDDGIFLDILAVSFPHGQYIDTRPLIARILCPYERDSLR